MNLKKYTTCIITPEELTLFVFDIPEDAVYDEAQGTAYDAEGNVMYVRIDFFGE